MKILSVDDNAESLYVLAAVLCQQGHEVDTASDGREALALAETGGYDLIISDVLMPRMDGYQLCREVRRHARLCHLPFVFYTATYAQPREASFALGLGADRFLLKPLEPETLLREVEGAVADRRRVVSQPVESEDEAIYLKEYNARLIAQMEARLHALEAANRELRGELETVARRGAAQKLEAVATLAGGIAHEFNNIIAGILGFADLGSETAGENATASTSFRAIRKAGQRGRELVTQVLMFARQGGEPREILDLAAEVRAALDPVAQGLPASIELVVEISGDVPPVVAAAAQVRQVVAQLVSNAQHAIGEKAGSVRVQLTAQRVDEELARRHPGLRVGSYVRLSVSDSGAGVEATAVGRIFDPFFTTKNVGSGTGLGLSVVHGIMQACDGLVAVDTPPGGGAAFHCFFPVLETDGPAAGENVGHGERVLFLDDEPLLAAIGEGYLKKLGYAPVVMRDPAVALAFLRENPCDLVVTDLSMPELSGIDFAREVWALRPEARVVLATCYSATLDAERARTMGFRELLLKPYNIHGLGECVMRALGT